MEKLEKRAAQIRTRFTQIDRAYAANRKSVDSVTSIYQGGPGPVGEYLTMKLRYLQRQREMLEAEQGMLAAELRLLQAARQEEETRHE